MNLLKSIKERFGGKSTILQEEELQDYSTPEKFDILLEKSKELYYESASFTIPMLQDRFNISYHTAAMVMDQLEEARLFDREDEDREWEGDL